MLLKITSRWIVMSSFIVVLLSCTTSNALSEPSDAELLRELNKLSEELKAIQKKLSSDKTKRTVAPQARGRRNMTHQDLLAGWVGKKADDLASSNWGPPQSIYKNHDGTKLYTYSDEWQTGYNVLKNKTFWGTCNRKFLVDKSGIIRKWGISGTCWAIEKKTPNTPIPKATL